MKNKIKAYEGNNLNKLYTIRFIIENLSNSFPEIQKEAKQLINKLNKIIEHSKETLRIEMEKSNEEEYEKEK